MPDYRLKVVFSNGIQGTVDFSWVLEAPAFERVRDPAEFAKVEIAPAGYITWGGDLDVGWESIYTKLSGLHWLNALPPSLKMILLVNAECLGGGGVRLEFNNGVEGEIDLDDSLVSDRPVRREDRKASDREDSDRKASGQLSFSKGKSVSSERCGMQGGQKRSALTKFLCHSIIIPVHMYCFASGQDLDPSWLRGG